MSWLRADIHFAALYSYRIPDTSPSYATCSPLPSPSAIRLSLVDSVIRHTGNIDEGRRLFQLAKAARLELQPPQKIVVLKFFLKRFLKPRPDRAESVSFGVREYCLFSDPMTVWIETDHVNRVAQAFTWLRRLGTTDSLAWCNIGEGTPDLAICMRPINELTLSSSNFARRSVFTLHELKAEASFDHVDPYASDRRAGADPFRKQLYVMPLVLDGTGENWVRYRREPFDT
jgi:hypothetical protein